MVANLRCAPRAYHLLLGLLVNFDYVNKCLGKVKNGADKALIPQVVLELVAHKRVQYVTYVTLSEGGLYSLYSDSFSMYCVFHILCLFCIDLPI